MLRGAQYFTMPGIVHPIGIVHFGALCEVNPYVCFAGDLCEEENGCASEPCSNGGTCRSLPAGEFYCQCLEGYEGPTCDSDIDECAASDDVCLNEGTCVNTGGSYRFVSRLESVFCSPSVHK